MSRVKTEKVFKTWGLGTVNAVQPELVPSGATSYSRNFIANKDRLELLGGRKLVGSVVDSNSACQGLHSIQKVDGDWVLFRKDRTKLQAINVDKDDEWLDSLTTLQDDTILYFSNSFTPAGRQVWANGVDGLFKIYPSALEDPVNLTDRSKNYDGYLLIEGSRAYVVGMEKDPTGLRYSRVDNDDNYVLVSGESVGSSGSTHYTKTLAHTQVFGIEIISGTKSLRDDKNGNLIGDGTGTINYATGELDVTFTDTTTAAVTVSYLYEDPLNHGLADFTYTSGDRLAGEGNVLRQDSIGTKSTCCFSFEGMIFTMQDTGSWKVKIESNDTSLTNVPFNQNVSCASPFGFAQIDDGVVYIDTSEENKPVLKKLSYNALSDKVEPKLLSEQFSFEGFKFDKAPMVRFNGFVIFSGASELSETNDTTFFYNIETGGIFAADNGYNMFVVCGNRLFGGDSASPNVYQLFDQRTDLGSAIAGEVRLGNMMYDTEQLKKVKKIYVEGFIEPAQSFIVESSQDRETWKEVGRISFADITVEATDETVGSVLFGDDLYGGSSLRPAPSFFKKALKIRMKKFERQMLRIRSSGIGHLSITQIKVSDIRKKGTKTLKKYKQR